MNLVHYLGVLRNARSDLPAACGEVGTAHGDEPDVRIDCTKFARRCGDQAEALRPFLGRYETSIDDEPPPPCSSLFDGPRARPLGLLRDLHDLYLMACDCDISWTMVGQGAQAARDSELLQVVRTSQPDTAMQVAWLRSRMKQAAPQALVVAE
jgi:hypothetical protein